MRATLLPSHTRNSMLMMLPELNLSPEERRLFGQVLSAADTEGLGVVTGDVALNFFPGKTRLQSEVLGEVRGSDHHTAKACRELMELHYNRYGRSQTQRTRAS